MPLIVLESGAAPDDEVAMQATVALVSAVIDVSSGVYGPAFHQGLMAKLGLVQAQNGEADAARPR